MFYYYGCARMRSAVGVICVVSIVLWYLEVGLGGEVGFAYKYIDLIVS
jgi:hypothetical protein